MSWNDVDAFVRSIFPGVEPASRELTIIAVAFGMLFICVLLPSSRDEDREFLLATCGRTSGSSRAAWRRAGLGIAATMALVPIGYLLSLPYVQSLEKYPGVHHLLIAREFNPAFEQSVRSRIWLGGPYPYTAEFRDAKWRYRDAHAHSEHRLSPGAKMPAGFLNPRRGPYFTERSYGSLFAVHSQEQLIRSRRRRSASLADRIAAWRIFFERWKLIDLPKSMWPRMLSDHSSTSGGE